jgi:hypothetical protein
VLSWLSSVRFVMTSRIESTAPGSRCCRRGDDDVEHRCPDGSNPRGNRPQIGCVERDVLFHLNLNLQARTVRSVEAGTVTAAAASSTPIEASMETLPAGMFVVRVARRQPVCDEARVP